MKKYCFLFLCFLFLNTAAYCEIVIHADKQFAYAEDCFSRRAFQCAATEFDRFIYFFPGDPRIDKAEYLIGISLFRNGRYEKAKDVFQRITEKEELSTFHNRAWLMLSDCYIEMDEIGSAVVTLHNFLMIADVADDKDMAHHKLGWIYLSNYWAEDMTHYRDPFQDALHSFGKIRQQNRGKFNVELIEQQLTSAGTLYQKNPTLAGTLSIVPGGGQVYCGRYQDGITAFLLNSGFILAAVESFDNEQMALGGLITVVGFGFYAGNIYGAVSSAHKYNRAKKRQFLENLKDTLQLDTHVNGNEILLGFSFRF